MREYDMPIEEQMKRLVKTLDDRFAQIDERFDRIDKKFDKVDEKFDRIDKKFDERFDQIDKRFDEVNERLDDVDETIGQISVRINETHVVAKLGLEGLEGLRQSMEAQFAAAAKTNADQTGLLKAVLVHVRNRVDVIERPKPRRR